MDICATESRDVDDEGSHLRQVDATVDSGAAHSVMNGDDFPHVPRKELEESRKEQ